MTHEEILNKIIAHECSNPYFEEGKFNEAKQEHIDGWREFNFEGHCVSYTIVARLISSPNTPFKYEIKSLTIK